MAQPRPNSPYYSACATVRIAYYGHRELPKRDQRYNRDHASLRAPGEGAFARLKSWRLDGGRSGRIVGPWICDPLPPPPIHPHSHDQVLAMLSDAEA